VTGSTAAGDLQVFQAGTTAPGTPTIDYSAGQTRANNAIATPSASGGLTVQCDQATGTVEFILDIDGYFEKTLRSGRAPIASDRLSGTLEKYLDI